MDKIIDLHNHSLPGVDDGAQNLEEAIANIEYLKSLGISDIVLTSHYILNSHYDVSVSRREDILTRLKNQFDNDNINLYLGNEVYISDSSSILDLLDRREITTLNGSRYLLIELPLHQSVRHIDRLLCDLNDKGITPIIAHPERYRFLQKDNKKIYDLLEYDCLLQCNLGSINGQYGRQAKKLVKWLLKKNLVSFIATDFHHVKKQNKLDKSLKKLNKIISSKQMEKLLYDNPKLVLENEKINNSLIVNM